MQTVSSVKDLASDYIQAVGEKRYDEVTGFLTPDVSFKGPATSTTSSDAFIAALKRMAPIWIRNDVRAVFAEGDRAAVFYDFVSNTPAGAMPCVELLTFRGERIERIELLFDREQFK
jgi:ketosteroid isomerase-like protein